MALVKVKGSENWWLDITVPVKLQAVHGKRIRVTTGTTDKPLAQRLHDERKAQLWREDKLGEAPKVTLAQAVARWKKGAEAEQMRWRAMAGDMLDWWVERLGASTPIADIKRRDVMDAVENMMTRPRHKGDTPRLAKPGTVNRYLQAIRGLLRKAAGEWELIEAAPTITLRKEPRGRVRALTPEEMVRLARELPEHWRAPFVFSLATGLRKSNVVGLRPDQVDLERARLLVGSDDFKNGEDFGIPLNETALGVLRGCIGQHPDRVFTYNGQPLAGLEHRTWKKALKRAGIEDFRWHDNRHTFATMFIEGGGDLDTLQKLGGWKDRAMVLRYAHFRTEHLRESSKKLDKVFGGLLSGDRKVSSETRQDCVIGE